jgi:hypothetical protein
MTMLSRHVGVPEAKFDGAARMPVGGSSIQALLVRLRDLAGRLVAFSETKLLLREAAMTIERLDRDAERHAAETARLTAELAHERASARTR